MSSAPFVGVGAGAGAGAGTGGPRLLVEPAVKMWELLLGRDSTRRKTLTAESVLGSLEEFHYQYQEGPAFKPNK
jgi:hypothetical protein